MKKVYLSFVTAVLCIAAIPAYAGQVTITNTFTAGTPAVAAEVNTNFGDVKTAVDDNDARIKTLENTIATLQSTITTLQAQLAAVNNSQVMALNNYLTVDTVSDARGPLVQFKGVNLQLINGTGTTDGVPNGLGNLIIGYDTARNDTTYHCSSGTYTSQATCQTAGETWAVSLKGGSHYLVIGDQNNYSQYGGIVNGYHNTSNNTYASVSGGYNNTASGVASSVSGGYGNTASGQYSSVSGGYVNIASGLESSISGGAINKASATYSSVSGGGGNTASGKYSVISGGLNGTASGGGSSVSGGNINSAVGQYSSVSGGYNHSAPNTNNWAAGTLLEAQ